jgi:hypothetical protein
MGNHRVGTTAKSGYIQRRIIKVCEDIQVTYDGSVRDATGKIYQLSYGDNGMDPCQTVKVNGVQQSCDISRMVDRLNLQFEINSETKENLKPIQVRQVTPPVVVVTPPVVVTPTPVVVTPTPVVVTPTPVVVTPTLVTKPIQETIKEKPVPSRISLLKELAIETGKNTLYKGWSIEELSEHLHKLRFKNC